MDEQERWEALIRRPDAAGRSVVEVRQVVRDRGGALLMDVVLQHVYRFEDDLIARMEIIA